MAISFRADGASYVNLSARGRSYYAQVTRGRLRVAFIICAQQERMNGGDLGAELAAISRGMPSLIWRRRNEQWPADDYRFDGGQRRARSASRYFSGIGCRRRQPLTIASYDMARMWHQP